MADNTFNDSLRAILRELPAEVLTEILQNAGRDRTPKEKTDEKSQPNEHLR